MIEIIRQRREALAAQLAQAKEQYEAIERTLAQLDRQICAMHGGLQELDTLLEGTEPCADSRPPP